LRGGLLKSGAVPEKELNRPFGQQMTHPDRSGPERAAKRDRMLRIDPAEKMEDGPSRKTVTAFTQEPDHLR
jgi:hypothetical protein